MILVVGNTTSVVVLSYRSRSRRSVLAVRLLTLINRSLRDGCMGCRDMRAVRQGVL